MYKIPNLILYIFSSFQAIQNISIFMICPNIFGESQGGGGGGTQDHDLTLNLIQVFIYFVYQNWTICAEWAHLCQTVAPINFWSNSTPF